MERNLQETQVWGMHYWDGRCTWPQGECSICLGLLSADEIALIKADDPKGWEALMKADLARA